MTLSPEDLVWFQASQQQMRDARAVEAFTLRTLAVKYGLNDGDRIQQDGTIVRNEMP